ncbi:esterase-like activity of phytase family protein [Agrobacterium genomosp. 13]|uniref:esterase-like activity of phytase family protein n=1 Tax=Agrobacterium genomosp. 13 TaxID=1183419 RepID=UPI0009BC0FD1|nr:esterase-like activity of phytase family protein [Agrobacterium genomosp. 13]
MRDKRSRASFSCKSLVVATALAVGSLVPVPIGASTIDVPVSVRQLSGFEVGTSAKRFGKLEFIGGMVMSAPEKLFGAMSSIRFRPDGEEFVSVLDTGHWLTGRVTRDAAGALSGLEDVRITAMLDAGGREPTRKMEVDAEGLALRDGKVFVSYEQRHRIDIYPDPGFETAKPLGRLPHLIPNNELRHNGGMEALAVSPADSPLAGALVVVAEKSIDTDGNLLAAILEGPLKGTFAVTHHPSFDVTDGAFLPNGDLLLLERRFNFAEGVGMRIRRIRGADIRPGAVVDGEILMEAGMAYQIDNMEGMDVVKGPDGSTRLIIVSDDNHSFLQRNLMLEFKLVE